MKKTFKETEESEEATDDVESLSWVYKEELLGKYFLLARRVPGFGTSFNEFLEMDTFSTEFLVGEELAIIEKEQAEYDKSKGKHSYTEFADDNAEEANELMETLQS